MRDSAHQKCVNYYYYLHVQNTKAQTISGEVSDSGSGGESDDEKFYDGYDENLIGDDEDKARLEQMTEKEREQELFNRMERRQVLKTR